MEPREIEPIVEAYEKPNLEVIDLVADEVFGLTCRTTSISGTRDGDCVNYTCSV
jgi:hypothetical protein